MRYLIIILLLSSCTASYHLRQAEKHLRKAEVKGAKVNRDTVFITKEVIVPEVKFDTLVKNVNFIDTVTVSKDRVITRVKVNTVTKEIYINTKCPADTVRIEVPVKVITEIDSGIPWWYLLIAGGIIILLLLIIIKK